jgi:inner membrane protein
MIFGHLPAGYLISSFTYARLGCDAVSRRAYVLAGMLGAVAPDFDLAYFYLFDERQHHHHTYFTHFPIGWLALIAGAACWFRLARIQFLPALALVFSFNGFVHMVLDSIVGDIEWLAPWNMQFFSLFEVRALYEPWWLNFILHWSFVLEVIMTLCAYRLWRYSADHRLAHLQLKPHALHALGSRTAGPRLKY